jgi:hypothetical protein
MQTAAYYIEQGVRAARIGSLVTVASIAAELRKMTEDDRDIAEDIGCSLLCLHACRPACCLYPALNPEYAV